MAKFKFSLAAVERVRIQKEQMALEEMSSYQRIYQEKIAAKKDLLDKKQKAFEEKNSLSAQASSIIKFQLVEEYIDGLKQHIIRADQAIIRARRFLDQAMRKYILARRERKMIDRLKEKALEAFKLEQARAEQKQLDDLVTMRSRLSHEEEIA